MQKYIDFMDELPLWLKIVPHIDLIAGVKFKEIAPQIEAEEGWQVIDCEGKVVTPGLVEAHCHLGGMSDGEPPGISKTTGGLPIARRVSHENWVLKR